MRKWTKTAGLLFWAVAAVYSDQATFAKTGTPANVPASNVKLLDDASTDPFASTQPSADPTDAGKSVSASEVSVDDTGTVEIHVTTPTSLKSSACSRCNRSETSLRAKT
jgi:hypothetical protein